MSLIKSISGIRGTIGGKPGNSLSPIDVVKFTAAYGTWLRQSRSNESLKVVVGRDARVSGEMINNLVTNTLIGVGIDVVELGLSTTPTVEFAVKEEEADGGIIVTASHNPYEWNALKMLNEKGEFISSEAGEKILKVAEDQDISFATVNKLGKVYHDGRYLEKHIKDILSLDLVDNQSISKYDFKVVVDGVNSSGGIAVPLLLKELGVKKVSLLNGEPTGIFNHNPEPLPENLKDISQKVIETGADFGIVVDPDVDRLAFIDENGDCFGEEYTLVAVADYVLSCNSGVAVSNLSSTRALRDVAQKHNGEYFASAVGEVNVVAKMKETGAVIGGEGNGGIIYPKNHYGRDALVGIALFLTHLAKTGLKCSQLRDSYPSYFIAKKKIQLTPDIDVDAVLENVQDEYKNQEINLIDGVKIDFDDSWVHLRKSNTEPIIRIYAEHTNEEEANQLAERFIGEINKSILWVKR